MFHIYLTLTCFVFVIVTGAGFCQHNGNCQRDYRRVSREQAERASDPDNAPLTRSQSGVFRGSWMTTRRGRRFQAYRGIRYAQPPVGELRFQAPRPLLQYEDVVDATEEGPVCPQRVSSKYSVSEDCLIINVYTPTNNSSHPLAVVVFFHPGGFYSFSGRSEFAGPHYILDYDIVLVTINYRLGSLGFLSLGTKLAPGNNGFKDQVAALQWVQRNIQAFGGDQNLVTIAGYSAGAVSVMAHMISPMSKGLFHRAISMSGSPISKVPSPSHRLDLAYKQAKIVNCPISNLTELYYCLKSKPWQELTISLLGFFEFGYDPLVLWRPVVEPDFGQDRFLSVEPMDAIRQGNIHAVPFIISMTTDEFFWKAIFILDNATLTNTMDKEWDRVAPISFILPRDNETARVRRLRREYLGDRPLRNDSFTADELGKLYGDAITAFPVHRMATLMSRHSPERVYYSQFAYIGNRSHYEHPETMKPLGVAHHDDLIYLFSLNYRFPMIEVSDASDSKMIDTMTNIWYNFAKYGDPNINDPTKNKYIDKHWPPMTPSRRSYLRIDRELSVGENLFEDRFKVWDELYPIQY